MSEEGAKLQYEKMQLERILVDVRKQELDVRTYITGAHSTIRAITAIKNGESSSSMISLGAGVMVKANIQTDSTLLMFVGGETAIEMSIDTATSYLETQISEKNATLNNIVVFQKNATDRLNFVNDGLNKLIESEGHSSGN